MSAVAMTLDEIIAEQKQKRRGGGGGGGGSGRRNISRPVRHAGGAPRRARSAGFDLDAPSGGGGGGKWKHDKFFEVYGGGSGGGASGGARRRGVGPRAGGSSRAGGKDSDDIVKLNLSNIAPTVVTSDLEELFAEFDVLGVAVHYDEGGSHLGTADLFVSRPSANTILREFVGVVLDSKEMRFAIVDEKSGRPTIRDRVQRVGGGPRGTRQGGVQKRVSGGGPRGGRKSDPGGAAKRISKLSADDLDKELEAYMGNKKA